MFLALMVSLMAAQGGAGTTAPSPAAELRMTFVGNMGFHLTDRRVAVLIDFPYQSGAFGYMEWWRGLVPKGPAPLCVISHSHDDHFAPRLAQDFCGSILGPKDVVVGSGVKTVDLQDEVRWEGISIRPVATPHMKLEHYSYLVAWGGSRLYFTGDTESTEALLEARGLDVAFVSPWLLKSVEGQGRRIDARQIVVYHHKTGELLPDAKGRIQPRQGDVLAVSGKAPVRVVQPGPDVTPKDAQHDEFERRLREALASVQTPAGRAYQEGAFNQQFYPTYAPRLSECMQQTGETDAPSFDLVLDLGGDGRVHEAMIRPETKLTTCFLALVKKDTFPAPPSAGFRLPVSIRFTKP